MTRREKSTDAGQSSWTCEVVRRLAGIYAIAQAVCAANGIDTRYESIALVAPDGDVFETKLSERQPFGFAFTSGQEAQFNVPPGYRLIIEQLQISSWSDNPHSFLQLVTKSRYMFRSLTLCGSSTELAQRDGCVVSSENPVQIQGLTSNTLLFGDGQLQNAAIVPPHTYVQIWGYLELTGSEEPL